MAPTHDMCGGETLRYPLQSPWRSRLAALRGIASGAVTGRRCSALYLARDTTFEPGEAAGEMRFDRAANAIGDLALSLTRKEEARIARVGHIAGLEQHRGRIRRLEHAKAGKAVEVRGEGHRRRHLALKQRGE